ncbi:unnamed protein product [Cuscuta campestris]|uniref:Outer envelope pore protein 16, chloroplastic n=1 Tax=Cuscuta campestris TaxID=132261 RepID=A0A484LKF9_9ASTE|nr:unnamed protein product [Cuscuta campestris]
MPRSRFAGSSLTSPKVDVVIDMGNPFLNHTIDAFLKIGTVAAVKTAAEESYYMVERGKVSQQKFGNSFKKMCREGAYWGTVAGVYAGMEYGVERIRGERDWKNAMVGGALAGALISAASSNNREKIVMDAITGGAIATAAEFLNHIK